MVLSYSAAASSSSTSQNPPEIPPASAITHDEDNAPSLPTSTQPLASTSTSTSTSTQSPQSTATATFSPPTQIQNLILDAGPFLSLTPLRNLASTLYTTPAVIGELRDPKVREYFRNLPLSGVEVKVQSPRAEFIAKVMAFAKKTGDYAVLSGTDLGVIALTLELEVGVNGEGGIRFEPPSAKGRDGAAATGVSDGQDKVAEVEGRDPDMPEAESDQEEVDEEAGEEEAGDSEMQEPMDDIDDEGDESGLQYDSKKSENAELEKEIQPDSIKPPTTIDPASTVQSETTAQDEDPDSDGEWITPKNLSHHRNHDLGLLPNESNNATSTSAPLAAACMTGDFAVQNVLLGMGLGLVGEGGKRISKVKSFVLRCHACFKICKDPSRKFCPSCGNPSLLRTTTTTSSSGHTRIHLKKNFQYQLRGTKFTIPDAKPGRAKGQEKGGSGLILREDQREWVDAVRKERGRVEKEERRVSKGVLGGWEDPDWLPEIISTGANGKGRSNGPGGMPTVGHGRRNPNQARRKR